MKTNFPPGVTESMIPGNTPEDEKWEEHLEKLGNSIKESVKILLEDEEGITPTKKEWLTNMMKMKFIELLDRDV